MDNRNMSGRRYDFTPKKKTTGEWVDTVATWVFMLVIVYCVHVYLGAWNA